MNQNDIVDKIVTWLVITSIVFLTVFLAFSLVTSQYKTGDVVLPSVPDGYVILYDDNNELLIVPDEYHFKADERGRLYLVK